MTNEELKENIINNVLSNDLLVLQWSDTDLLANQYSQAIATQKDLELVYIDELDDIQSYVSPFDFVCPYLFVLHTDVFDSDKTDFSVYDNVIIICKSLEKKTAKFLNGYIVKLDKVEPWQIADYISTRCAGVDQEHITALCTATQNNVDRLDTLCSQIELFEPEEQNQIIEDLLLEPNTDLYYNTAFNLVDAIVGIILNRDVSKNMSVIHEILSHRNCCDITTLYVVTILLTKLRNIAIICYGGKVKANAFVGKDGKTMSDKQYYFYKKAFAVPPAAEPFLTERISYAISFLSSIDSELKLGNIELSESYFLDYIITHLLAK